MIFVETPSNPDLSFIDLDFLGSIEKQNPNIIGKFTYLWRHFEKSCEFHIFSCGRQNAGFTVHYETDNSWL